MSEVNQEFKAYCAAFAKFQSEVNKAENDGENPFLKSTYATLASIISTLRPALANNGLSFTQDMRIVERGYQVNTTIRHAEGYSETVIFDAALPPVNGAQALGSLSTYLKRYALVSVFGLATGEEDDGESASASQKFNSQQQKPLINQSNVSRHLAAINSSSTYEAINSYWKSIKDSISDEERKIVYSACSERTNALKQSQEAFNAS